MRPAARRVLLLGSVAAVLAIPAIAQVQNAAQAPPAAAPPQATAPAPQTQAQSGVQVQNLPDVATAADLLAAKPPPPVEYPRFARRDPFVAGALDPSTLAFGGNGWGRGRLV